RRRRGARGRATTTRRMKRRGERGRRRGRVRRVQGERWRAWRSRTCLKICTRWKPLRLACWDSFLEARNGNWKRTEPPGYHFFFQMGRFLFYLLCMVKEK